MESVSTWHSFLREKDTPVSLFARRRGGELFPNSNVVSQCCMFLRLCILKGMPPACLQVRADLRIVVEHCSSFLVTDSLIQKEERLLLISCNTKISSLRDVESPRLTSSVEITFTSDTDF